MNFLLEALAWIFSPDRLEGSTALPARIGEHLLYTGISIVIAALIAVPLGYLIGHTGRGREIAVGVSGAARALPSLGLTLLLVLLIGVTGMERATAAVVAFVLLAIPSTLAGAYAGIQAIDRTTVDAARSMGMTEWQILTKVEIPLGMPLLVGGLRNSVLQVVATVTVAGYVNLGGLGLPLLQGLELRRYEQVLGSALVVIALALILDGLLAAAQRIAVPRGVLAGRVTDVRGAPTRRRPAAGIPASREESIQS
ncbi:MAG: ABC transporter permease subunit [Actinomycetota bacterium]|nr:ABC transporter permease subunit [Actinomycetota bacterium]